MHCKEEKYDKGAVANSELSLPGHRGCRFLGGLCLWFFKLKKTNQHLSDQ